MTSKFALKFYWLKTVFTPLRYLRIRHEKKYRYDWWIPIGLSATGTLVVFLLGDDLNFFGPRGVLDRILDLIRLLTGFYIASLGVVATISRASMDRPMLGTPPTIRKNGIDQSLTRREYLVALFGFLSFSSLFTYLVGSFIQLLEPFARNNLILSAIQPCRLATVFIVLILFASIMVNTLLALAYMSDRIHNDSRDLQSKE